MECRCVHGPRISVKATPRRCGGGESSLRTGLLFGGDVQLLLGRFAVHRDRNRNGIALDAFRHDNTQLVNANRALRQTRITNLGARLAEKHLNPPDKRILLAHQFAGEDVGRDCPETDSVEGHRFARPGWARRSCFDGAFGQGIGLAIVKDRTVDAMMAIPQLIVVLILLSIFGSSIANLIVFVGILGATPVFRVARSVAMNVAVMEYVEDARVRGETLSWIVFREILPNILPTLVAEFGMRFCFVFLTISALSFLGLGIQPPTADWGSMVRENSTLISYGDVTPLLPAGAIALLAVSMNFLVDWFLHTASGLRDEH